MYFLSMYVIAFARESLGSMTFIMIMMLHPAIVIPMGYLVECLKDLARFSLNMFGFHYDYDPQMVFQRWLRKFFTFSTVPYLAFIMGVSHLILYSGVVK